MSTARRIGGLVAGALAATFLIWGAAGGWSKAADYSWDVRPWELALAVTVLAAFFCTWVIGYVVLLEMLCGRPVPHIRLAGVWARSLLGRYVPGNVVMVTGRVVLGREAGVPGRVSIAASAYEQIAMLIMAALAAAAFLVSGATDSRSPLLWTVVLVPLAGLLLDPALFQRGLARLARHRGGATELIALRRSQVATVLLWFGGVIALMGIGSALSVQAVAGTDTGSVPFLAAGFLLAWVVSMVAFVFPSGLGVREGVFAVVLGTHLPGAAAIALAAAARLLLTAVELVVVLVMVLVARRASPGGSGEATLTAPPAHSRG